LIIESFFAGDPFGLVVFFAAHRVWLVADG
jgi:hypothetical protein